MLRDRSVSQLGRAQLAPALLWASFVCWFAVAAVLIPLLRVLTAGVVWLGGSLALAAVIVITGFAVRRLGAGGLMVLLAQVTVWTFAITAGFGRGSGWMGVVPTPETITEFRFITDTAIHEIMVGFAPLTPGRALTVVIIASAGLIAIVIDMLLVTFRMPLLATAAVVATWLIPAIAVRRGVDILAFVALAAAVLLLFQAATTLRRARERVQIRVLAVSDSPRSTRAARGTLAATGFALGTVAIVATLVIAPATPINALRPGTAGPSKPVTSLNLGSNLRQPEAVDVLTLTTTAAQAPYLRIATMSSFNGDTWQPDRARMLSVSEQLHLGNEDVDAEIARTAETTVVSVQALDARLAPVPYPADQITGLQGEWLIEPLGRTVSSDTDNANGQQYTVQSAVPQPSAEQLNAREADRSKQAQLVLPEEVSPLIGDLAAQVTAGAGSDYQALLDLQSWFRGGEFQYSLDAPVRQDFDGSGVEAVERFLLVRSGYCVHFAAAFALMARVLDMPSRIVIGYRPGEATGRVIEGEPEYRVTSAQLHAWPEVYFTGVGWIGFEPTSGLGRATEFTSTSTQPEPAASVSAAPTSAAPEVSASPSADAAPADVVAESNTATTSTPGVPVAAGFAGAVLLLSAPSMLAALRRRARLRAARAGDAVAAWRFVQESAMDLGVPVHPGDSPRTLGVRLAQRFNAPAAAVGDLVEATEHASYGPGPAALPAARVGAGLVLAEPQTASPVSHAQGAAAIRRALVKSAPAGWRIRAAMLPRSLTIRPGSARARRGR